MSERKYFEMQWTGNAWQPCTMQAIEAFEGTKKGQTALLSYWKPRNIKHHRKLFALLNKVISSGGWDYDLDSLLHFVKLNAGYVALVFIPQIQEYIQVPKSISFASMSQDEFEKFYDKAIECCAQLLGVSRETLENEVNHETLEVEEWKQRAIREALGYFEGTTQLIN